MKKSFHIFLWRVVLFTIPVVCGISEAMSQGMISGRVIDDSTSSPIINANVFIANAMLGSSTDTAGQFKIRNIPNGSYDLIASCVGYSMTATKIRISRETEQTIVVRLRPRVLSLDTVEIVAPNSDAWKKDLETFKTLLLGSTPEASECRLVNPEIIEFSADGSGGFQAQANQILVVENMALGYRLHVSLGTFSLQKRWLSAAWKVKYEELSPVDDDQREEWGKNRGNAYAGSFRHFLVALLDDRLSAEGFKMYFWKTSDRDFAEANSYFLLDRSDVARKCGSDEWAIRFDDNLVVVYTRADGYTKPGLPVMTRAKTSILTLKVDSLVVDAHGQILERWKPAQHTSLLITGDWGMEGLAREVPLEFEPRSTK